jgi:ABC-type Zn uptake system ZnuABC Zn-binding protein ZnuA
MRKWAMWMTVMLLLGVTGAAGAQDAPLRVMATTSILADVAAQVAGPYAQVDTLLPPDTDAHVYEPTTNDALRLTEADLLLTVGAGYEAFIQSLLDNAGADVPVIEANQGVAILPLGGAEDGTEPGTPLGILGVNLECGAHAHEEHEDEDAVAHDEDEHAAENCDPHTWMNPLNVIVWAQNIAEALAAADPAHADAYFENAALYADELQALDAEIAALVAGLPDANRRLVTNHENLQYFATRYGFETVAVIVPGGSSEAEPDPQALADVIRIVQAQNVPAIFIEVTANSAYAETVASDTGAQLVSGLYIEALSEPDGPAPTYLDLMRYNAGVIVNALMLA